MHCLWRCDKSRDLNCSFGRQLQTCDWASVRTKDHRTSVTMHSELPIMHQVLSNLPSNKIGLLSSTSPSSENGITVACWYINVSTGLWWLHSPELPFQYTPTYGGPRGDSGNIWKVEKKQQHHSAHAVDSPSLARSTWGCTRSTSSYIFL